MFKWRECEEKKKEREKEREREGEKKATTTRSVWVRPLPAISHGDVDLKQLRRTVGYDTAIDWSRSGACVNTLATYNAGI